MPCGRSPKWRGSLRFPPPSYPGPRVHRCASHWRERLGSAITGTGAPGAGNCAPYSHLCPSGGTCSGSSSRSDPLPALAAVTGPGCQRWLGDTDTVPSGRAQGSNPGLLHCRQILCHLSHNGSPYSLDILLSRFRTSLLFHCSVVSNSLRPHGLQLTRLPYPSSEWAQENTKRVLA